MKTAAYIINNNTVIATVNTELKNGSFVKFSNKKIIESINASREFNLVNAQTGKISRTKKWEREGCLAQSAIEINKGEFYI